jgi:hypothetical protein
VQHHLLQVEGIAAGLLEKGLRGLRRHGGAAAQRRRQLGDALERQRCGRDRGRESLTPQLGEHAEQRVRFIDAGGTVGREEQQRRGARATSQVQEELNRGDVGPVQVLNPEQDAAGVLRRAGEEGGDGLVQAETLHIRAGCRRRHVLEVVGCVGQERQYAGRGADLRVEHFGREGVPVLVERLDEGQVGGEALRVVGAADEHAHPVRGGPRRELGREARLADSRLTADQDGAPVARARRFEQCSQRFEVGIATYERRGAEGILHGVPR